MTGERLPQVCWCDANIRWATPEQVRDGEGWSCHPDCQPGCEPYAGIAHRRGGWHRPRPKGCP